MKPTTWWWIGGAYLVTVWITNEKGYQQPFGRGLLRYLGDLADGRTSIDPRERRPTPGTAQKKPAGKKLARGKKKPRAQKKG